MYWGLQLKISTAHNPKTKRQNSCFIPVSMSFPEPKSWLTADQQAAMLNPHPMTHAITRFPLLDAPAHPCTSSMGTLFAQDARHDLV
jgi:hypothetical protein